MFSLKSYSLVALATFALVLPSSAADIEPEAESINLSYLYAPILGTGYYKAGAEKAFVLKLSLENTRNETRPEKRYRWLMPVTLGLRKTDFDKVFELEGELPNQFQSISVMPGLAWDFQPAKNWQLTPSVQLGLARDFSVNTTTAIYSANLRGLGQWKIKGSTLSWGNRARAAGQHNFDLDKEQGFVSLETGLDWEMAPSLYIGNKAVSFSLYTQLQIYLPDVGIRGFSGEHIDAKNLLYLGATAGLEHPVRVLGFSIQRIGLSLVRGDKLRAITFNLGFPLFVD